MPELSIVVGTFNRRDQLRACLESIEAETSCSYVIYVTDAGSTDGTIEYLESISGDRIKPIFEGQKLGQARSYNSIFRNIETPYTCWLSDDNVVVNRGLDRAVRVLKENSDIGLVALKVKDRVGPLVKAPYIGGISSLGILNVNQGVLQTSALNAVGGFSEIFRDYGIDPDLTAKILFAGSDVAYLQDVAVYHDRNWCEDETTAAFHELKAKHSRFHRLYEAKYAGHLPASRIYGIKQGAWRLLKICFPDRLSINNHRRILDLLPRDWFNIFNGRFISLADPILCMGKDYHLRQKADGSMKKAGAPVEPEDVHEQEIQPMEATIASG